MRRHVMGPGFPSLAARSFMKSGQPGHTNESHLGGAFPPWFAAHQMANIGKRLLVSVSPLTEGHYAVAAATGA
jgi:hypothetical protein